MSRGIPLRGFVVVDVVRSSGGVWRVTVYGVLFGVFAILIIEPESNFRSGVIFRVRRVQQSELTLRSGSVVQTRFSGVHFIRHNSHFKL